MHGTRVPQAGEQTRVSKDRPRSDLEDLVANRPELAPGARFVASSSPSPIIAQRPSLVFILLYSSTYPCSNSRPVYLFNPTAKQHDISTRSGRCTRLDRSRAGGNSVQADSVDQSR